jgi:hypothetical protein
MASATLSKRVQPHGCGGSSPLVSAQYGSLAEWLLHHLGKVATERLCRFESCVIRLWRRKVGKNMATGIFLTVALVAIVILVMFIFMRRPPPFL